MISSICNFSRENRCNNLRVSLHPSNENGTGSRLDIRNHEVLELDLRQLLRENFNASIKIEKTQGGVTCFHRNCIDFFSSRHRAYSNDDSKDAQNDQRTHDWIFSMKLFVTWLLNCLKLFDEDRVSEAGLNSRKCSELQRWTNLRT